MFSIFNKRAKIQYPLSIPGNLEYLTRLANHELDKVLSYYRKREARVENSNILIRMIKWFPNPTQPYIELLSLIDDLELSFYRHFNITSPASVGDNQKSILVATEFYQDYFNLPELDKRQFLKPIFYTGIDYGFTYPEFTPDMITMIDIKAIMLSYREWILKRRQVGLSDDPDIFVYQYVMPSMIPGIFSLSLFNHIFFKETKIPPVKNTHPFQLRDLTPTIIDYVNTLQKYTMKKMLYYDEFLQYIKLPFYGDMHQYLIDDFLIITAQNRWVYWIAKGIYLTQIIDYLPPKCVIKNSLTIREIKQANRTIRGDSILTRASLKRYHNIATLLRDRLEYYSQL